ncbi:hypothetical protein IWX49DRAFT_111712 [Phyllosticta citricarpa]
MVLIWAPMHKEVHTATERVIGVLWVTFGQIGLAHGQSIHHLHILDKCFSCYLALALLAFDTGSNRGSAAQSLMVSSDLYCHHHCSGLIQMKGILVDRNSRPSSIRLGNKGP